MSSLESRRLNHLESAIWAASGEQIVTIERLVAEVASMRVAEVALARRTEVTRAERRCPHCGTAGGIRASSRAATVRTIRQHVWYGPPTTRGMWATSRC